MILHSVKEKLIKHFYMTSCPLSNFSVISFSLALVVIYDPVPVFEL